jgi:hypothetical protein
MSVGDSDLPRGDMVRVNDQINSIIGLASRMISTAWPRRLTFHRGLTSPPRCGPKAYYPTLGNPFVTLASRSVRGYFYLEDDEVGMSRRNIQRIRQAGNPRYYGLSPG